MDSRKIGHIAFAILLLFSSDAFSQMNNSELNNFRETVLISSSRHLYLSGESIEFHTSVFEQDTYQQSSLSQNIRVELINSLGQAIKKYNLKLEAGVVRGLFVIPGDSPSGWYYLRAYTNWMRNFGSEAFAVMPIKILNPQEDELSFPRQHTKELSIKIFPLEDGTAVFTSYGEKQGSATKGWLLNSEMDTVSSFSTHDSGWTFLQFILDRDEDYTVTLDSLKQHQYISKPEIDFGSPTTILIENSDDYIRVRLSANSLDNNQKGSIIIHQSYTAYWESEQVFLKDLNLRIPKSKLPTGIFQLSLISDNNSILSKRLWSEYHPDRLTVSMDNITDNTHLRSHNSFDYNLLQSDGIVSVLIGLSEPQHPYINHLPGLRGWKGTSLIPNDELAFQGWLAGNSYQDDILISILESRQDESVREPEFLPETRSGLISGKVYNIATGLVISDIGVSITVLNNNYFDACRTDDNGQFYFALPGLSGTSDYILNFTSEADSGMQIVVNPDFEPALNNTSDYFFLNNLEINYLKILNTNRQIRNIYGLIAEFSEKAPEDNLDRITFFHPPDQIVVLDEFIKLANIREIIYEVVPNVSVRKLEGVDYIRVSNNNSFDLSHKTLVLLDGIPLVKHADLLGLSPDRIERIEVKNRTYVYGRNIYSAIVNFVSPNKDYAGLDLPSSSVLSTLKLPVSESLVKSENGKEGPGIPLLENIIFWENDISGSQGEISFSANDLSGIFNVYISGFSRDGNWIFGSKTIKIKTSLK